MANTLEELGGFVRKVREAKMMLRDTEKAQNQFIVKNMDELLDRGIVSIKVKEGQLFSQMDHEMGRERTMRVMGS